MIDFTYIYFSFALAVAVLIGYVAGYSLGRDKGYAHGWQDGNRHK